LLGIRVFRGEVLFNEVHRYEVYNDPAHVKMMFLINKTNLPTINCISIMQPRDEFNHTGEKIPQNGKSGIAYDAAPGQRGGRLISYHSYSIIG
jgi:hypothetical protein